jgi:hypothetical protein
MAPGDQEMLIQHIVKRQGDLLRTAREQAELMQAMSANPSEGAPKSADV